MVDKKLDPIVIKTVLPHQLAWLHRSELDHDGMQIWEKPDGKLYVHDYRKKTILRLGILPKMVKKVDPKPLDPV